MSLPSEDPEPVAMGIAELQDYLVAIAEAARAAIATHDYGSVRNSRQRLRAWVDTLTGAKLALVEVALGFLDNLMGVELSDGAVAVRRFLDGWAEQATPFLDQLVRGHLLDFSVTKLWPEGARTHLVALEKAGVIVRDEAQAYFLAPTAGEWLRDAIEPLQFRMWRIVASARGRAASLNDGEAQLTTLAALAGVSEAQAQAHLARSPLRVVSRASHRSRPRYERDKLVNVPTQPRQAAPVRAITQGRASPPNENAVTAVASVYQSFVGNEAEASVERSLITDDEAQPTAE